MAAPRWSILAILLLAAPAAEAAEGPEKLVVLELIAERGVDESLTRLLNEMILSGLAETGRFEVMGGSDVKAMLSVEQTKSLLGCSDTSCMAEIGGALGGDLLLVANLGKVGDFYLYNVKLIDVRNSTVVQRFTRQIEADENELVAAAQQSVHTIAQAGSPAPRAKTTTATVVEASPSEQSASGPSQAPTKWIALGLTAACGVAGAAMFAMRGSKGSIEGDEYQAFLDAPLNERDARYEEVQNAVDRHNTNTRIGWAFVGLTAIGAGVTAWLFSSDDGTQVSALPLAGGAVVSLTGVLP